MSNDYDDDTLRGGTGVYDATGGDILAADERRLRR
jgi:hypothetical protein